MSSEINSQAIDAADTRSHADMPSAAQRVPPSLKIVASVFILVGTLSIVEMLVDWFVFSRISIDFFSLFIFIGWGLLHWRPTSRRWAVFITWLAIILLSIWFPLAVYVVVGGSLPSGVNVGGATPIGLLTAAFAIAYIIWQLRLVTRSNIVARFETSRLGTLLEHQGVVRTPPRRPWQFSLESLLLATVVVALVCARLTSDDLMYETDHLTGASGASGNIYRYDSGVRTSRFGNRADELLYVVLTSGNKSLPGYVQSVYGSFGRSARLVLPDGPQMMLPGEYQLYEIVDGELRHRPERVTKDEFDDFVDSNPSDWTLDALVQHAEKMRAAHAD